MQILLVHPQHELYRKSTGIYGKYLRYAPLTMPTLKALIPEDIVCDVKIVDEMVEEIDFSLKPDLVAITAITGTAHRAYQIADHFRTKGSSVVIGGVHATLMPDEVKKHADAVAIGYAESTWPQILRDFQNGCLQKTYVSDKKLDHLTLPDRSHIQDKDYLGSSTMEVSKGCVNNCDFCTTNIFHSHYHQRPIEEVIHEIRSLNKKMVVFLDANIVGDVQYAKDFFRALIPLKKWWVSCASLNSLQDDELVQLMSQSGCKGLLIGFETMNQDSLFQYNKSSNLGKDYKAIIKKLHDHHIMVQGNFVFGFDQDDPGIFERTAKFVTEAKIDLPQFSILTPIPGTRLFDRIDAQKRIFTKNWDKYTCQEVVFQPAQMSVKQLEEGITLARDLTYSYSSIIRRLWSRPWHLKLIILLSNGLIEILL